MTRSGRDEPNSSGRIRLLAGVGLLVAAAFVVYRPSLHGEFILDDDLYLTENQAITAPGGLLQIWTAKQEHDYYPVSASSLWLEWRLWGAHSTGYHLTNVVLHIGTAVLVWRLLWILAVPGAFLAGLLFAVHPVNVESVAWIAQRKDMLAAAFFLMSILCYLRDEDNRASKEQPSTEQQGNSFWMAGRWYWLSLLVFILALFSKGTATILPLALAWVLWWRRPLRWSDIARLAPFVVLGGLLVLVNIWFQTYGLSQEIRTVTFTQRFLGAAAAVWFYAAKALVPINLFLVYPQWHIQAVDIRWWFPLLAVIVFTIILWRQRSDPSARAVMFAWGFFCIALIPVMGFADVGFMQYSLVADHYQHIALIAAVALLSAAWATWWQQSNGAGRLLVASLAVVACGALAALTIDQSTVFADPVTLYSVTLTKNPNCSLIENNLGLVLADRGQFDDAIQHFRRAIELKSDCHEAYNNLGTVLADTQGPQQAIVQFQKSLQIKPDYPEAHFNLGLVLARINQPAEAIAQFEEALRLRPNYPDAHVGLGIRLAEQGRLPEAIGHFQTAVELKPDYADAYNSLGVALVRAGQPQAAIEQYQKALQLNPRNIDWYSNLAEALARTNRMPEAIAEIQKGLEVARAEGQTEQINRFENLLRAHRVGN